MYIELKISELRDIKSLLQEIEYDVGLAINGTHDYIDNGEYLGGYYSTEVSEGMEERNADLQEAMRFIQNFEQRIDEVIEAIKYSGEVENEEVVFIYDSEQFEKNLNAIKDLLDFNGEEYKQVINASSGYIDWEKSVTKKLDNPDANIFDAVEEIKQRDDERVFRHNRDIMKGLGEKIRDITYLDSIENIEDIKKKLDGLDSLDEIKEITDILVENTSFGSPIEGNTDIKAIDGSDVYHLLNEKKFEEIEEYYMNQLPNYVLDFIKNFQSYGGFTIQMANGLNIEAFNKLNFFKIDPVNGGYKVSLAYDSLEDWYNDYPNHLNKLLDDAFEEGLEGIYKYDPDNEVWYTIENGEKKIYKSLPDRVAGYTNKGLMAAGFALDGITIYDGIKNHDPSETWSGIGSALGGLTAIAICSPIPFDGVAMVVIDGFAGIVLANAGAEAGENIGEGIEEEQIKEYLDENGIDIIWE